MTRQVYEEALAPKMLGSWNLHELLPRDMEFFVLLSSFAGVIGNRGQSNYAVITSTLKAGHDGVKLDQHS